MELKKDSTLNSSCLCRFVGVLSEFNCQFPRVTCKTMCSPLGEHIWKTRGFDSLDDQTRWASVVRRFEGPWLESDDVLQFVSVSKVPCRTFGWHMEHGKRQHALFSKPKYFVSFYDIFLSPKHKLSPKLRKVLVRQQSLWNEQIWVNIGNRSKLLSYVNFFYGQNSYFSQELHLASSKK